MADYRRGVYEPSTAAHVFDGSIDEEDSEGSRLPLLIVIALFVLAAFGGVVWLAYEKGVTSGRTEPRTIFADSGPAKVAPDNQTETQTPYKGLKIYDQQAPNDDYESTKVQKAARAQPRALSGAASATPPLRAPLNEAPALQTGEPAQTPVPSVEPRTKPVLVERAIASPPTNDGAERAATLEPASTGASTAKQPVAGAAAPASLTAGGSTASTTEPATGTSGAPGQAATESGESHGVYLLQVGSYKSQVEADAAWSAFQAKHSALVGGFSTDVKPADLGDKGTWYRLRFGPFSDKDAAAAMCERIRADGGNCILSR